MQHQGQINAARTATGTYDYSACFEYVKEEIGSVDLAIATLEVTLGGKPYNCLLYTSKKQNGRIKRYKYKRFLYICRLKILIRN